ncbi:MAG: HAMP domain-containing protein [Leptospiraceae bacterium]|nr:HAMP domain-containing protein [Leptospiraceae bacterium]
MKFFNFHFSSIITRFLVPLAIFSLPLWVVAWAVMSWFTGSILEGDIRTNLEFRGRQLQGSIEALQNQALWVATIMADYPGVEDCYDLPEDTGRRCLRNKVTPVYNDIKQNLGLKLIKLHYHKPPARSFLRMWREPGQKDGGDDISAFRQTVLDVSRNKKSIRGVEVGRGGLVIRGLAPVIRQGRYYGSAELLFGFQQLFDDLAPTERLAVLLKPDPASIINEPALKAKMFALGDYQVVAVSNDDFKAQIQFRPRLAKMQDGQYRHTGQMYIYAIDLLDYKKEVIGKVLLGRNEKELLALGRNLQIGLGVMVLLVGLLTFAIIVRGVRRIRSGILQVTDSLADLSQGEGDLTVRLPVREDTHDELDKLSIQFNSFMERIRDVIVDIRQLVETQTVQGSSMQDQAIDFSSSAQGQAAIAEEIQATTDQIARGLAVASDHAEGQVGELGQLNQENHTVAQLVQQMSAQFEETARMAQSMANQSATATGALQNMKDSMQRIQSVVNEVEAATGIINDISEKVNLLALNASIESARAGDAGRGFAVVAEEISRLADQTARSIRDIEELIRSSAVETQKGSAAIEQASKVIASMLDYVEETGGMVAELHGIVQQQSQSQEQVNQRSESVRKAADTIKQLMQTQKEAVLEIARAIQELNERTQNFAGGSQKITETIKTLNDSVQNTRQKVRFFRV